MLISELDKKLTEQERINLNRKLQERIKIYSELDICAEDIANGCNLKLVSRSKTNQFKNMPCDYSFSKIKKTGAVSVSIDKEMIYFDFNNHLSDNYILQREMLGEAIVLGFVLDFINENNNDEQIEEITMLSFSLNDNPTQLEEEIFKNAVDLLIPNKALSFNEEQIECINNCDNIDNLVEIYKMKLANDYNVDKIVATYKMKEFPTVYSNNKKLCKTSK